MKELSSFRFDSVLFSYEYIFFSCRDAHKHVHFDTFNGQDRLAFDGARREIEQYRYKIDGLTHDVIAFRQFELKVSNIFFF